MNLTSILVIYPEIQDLKKNNTYYSFIARAQLPLYVYML